jgi:hypothetical protein
MRSGPALPALLAAVVLATPFGAAAQVIPTSEWVSLWSDATRLNTNPVPVGATIRVYDPDGVLCGECRVGTPGSYGLLAVYRDDAFTPDVDEGAEPGDTLLLTVDGVPARPAGPDAAVWTQNGDVLCVNLLAERVFPTTEWVSFWSDATDVRGNPVAPGAVVRAYDPGGVLCGEFTVVSPGNYGLMPVYRDDPATADFDEGAEPGEAISFTIDGDDASPLGPDAAVWTANGRVAHVDLRVVLVSTTLIASKLESLNGDIRIRWKLASPVDRQSLRLLRRPGRDGGEALNDAVITQVGSEYEAVDRGVVAGVTYTYRLRIDGEGGPEVVALGSARIAPPAFSLSPAYPNPFRVGTMLRFDLAAPAAVTVAVHDAAGHRIRRLIDESTYPAGRHEVFWDGRDPAGRPVPAGVYFVRLSAGRFNSTVKVTVVR